MTTAAVKIIGAVSEVKGKVQGVEHLVQALEVKVDGRLSELLIRTEKSALAEGREAGRGEMIVAVPPTPIFEGDKLVVPIPTPMPTVVLVPKPEDK